MEKRRRRVMNREGRRHRRTLPVGRRSLTLEVLEPRILLSGPEPTVELFGTSQAVFVENQGQWPNESALYMFQGSGANVLHTNAGPVFELFQRVEGEDGEETMLSTSLSPMSG